MNFKDIRLSLNQKLDEIENTINKQVSLKESDFVGFPSLSRYSKETVYITEKIDGTNAQIFIDDLGVNVLAGSRNRWISPGDDNAGFAKWVEENKSDILKLGPGRHFGEWYGQGIQRGYGLKEKRFALFNTTRHGDPAGRPSCCSVVPTLSTTMLGSLDHEVNRCMKMLMDAGSVAVPGFMRPEGIVVYMPLQKAGYKMTFEGDKHKWESLKQQI